MTTEHRLGIAGGGAGGLAAAIALRKQSHGVTVFEQARGYINLTPNVVRAIDGLDAGAAIRLCGARAHRAVRRGTPALHRRGV